ncbi:glutamine synthetase [Myxococcota bacterium]|nr:glutamine synthetase [Myxococcota bacterium]MBU1413220.1 glutamine synthetase [Myxococcota bacterium]
MMRELVTVVPEQSKRRDELKEFILKHPYLRFVSLVGIDLLGNDTDERIPIEHFLKNLEDIFAGGVQTDGSSVNLPGIAELNDAKVDFIIDFERRWVVDYNHELVDDNGLPTGTIRIPVFFRHHDRFYCSRSVLHDTLEHVRRELRPLLAADTQFLAAHGIGDSDIADVYFTLGTELEFWVSSPAKNVSQHELRVTQALKESYWKRTRGDIRTCLEDALIQLQRYGLEPEMGHKEVGGVHGKISEQGRLHDVMEQLEVDWRFSDPVQAADNDILARFIIKDVFMRHGLSVTFVAKPVEGIAGSGKHMHVGMGLLLRDGRRVNLFDPNDPDLHLSNFGFGAIMGLLRHWEVINPFVSHSNSALRRLQPGFEAPVSIVTSLGTDPRSPSRNRTVLAGLVRGDGPLSIRFEVRAPNPHTNSYLACAAFYLAMLDGIRHAAGRTPAALLAELSKNPGEPAAFLATDRAYLSEEDIFEHYTEAERTARFGKSPDTVWEIMTHLEEMPDLYRGTPMSEAVVRSFHISALNKWRIDSCAKEFGTIRRELGELRRLQAGENALDEKRWSEFERLRAELLRDDEDFDCEMTRLVSLFDSRRYAEASDGLVAFRRRVAAAREAYRVYAGNLL